MGLLNFLKKAEKTHAKPNEIIGRIVDFLPEFYKTFPQFKNCEVFLENKDWKVATDCLISLAKETKHYFSNDFWFELADAADQMKMKKQADYCKQQIQRNSKEIKYKIPFGSTVAKIDDTHFEHRYCVKLKLEWVAERRDKDNVQSLINKDGVHLKSHGRNGFIYYVEKEKVIEIEYELGMKGLIIWFESVDSWVLPVTKTLTSEEKNRLKKAIELWAHKTGNAIDFN